MNEEQEFDIKFETETDLDIQWIENFEVIDKKYKKFYNRDIKIIKFHYIYVNNENEIEQIKKDKILLKTPNYISREEIIGLIKKNNKIINKSYSVLSILKYNIDISPNDINYYLEQEKNQEFLKSIINIDAIQLNKSISMFHKLNDITIIFYEKEILNTYTINNNSNTIFHKLNNINNINNTNNTKNILLNNKTKRRHYYNHIYNYKTKTYRK